MNERTRGNQGQIQRANGQAPVLPRLVRGEARILPRQLTLKDTLVDAHIGDELEGGHGGNHRCHERDVCARVPEPRVDDRVAHRSGGAVRGRVPRHAGHSLPINAPAERRRLDVTDEKVEDVEPVMGLIIVVVREPQPRADKHGEEGIVEALAVLRKEVRRVRRARVQLADQPRLQRHVTLVCRATVTSHGTLPVPPSIWV